LTISYANGISPVSAAKQTREPKHSLRGRSVMEKSLGDRRRGTNPPLMQSTFEFSFAHLRTSGNVSPPRLRIELCSRLPVIGPLAPVIIGCTLSFARLGSLWIFSIFLFALVF
jgi:hypothetical protein